MKHLTTTLAVAALSVAAFAAPAHAIGTPKAGEFVQKASIGGMFEVQESQLALQKSTNTDVKGFAQHMIDDHTAANNTLKSTAEQAGFGSSVATALDSKHQKMFDKLSKEDAGKDFDKQYVDDQKKAHKEAVSLFKKYGDKGDNAALKSFASTTEPTLQAHEDALKAVDDSVGKE